MQMMEKFKNPLQKCSRCTECEAPVISIQTQEQKASCGFISPAPRPLPLPRPPWQRENIWEGAPEQSIKPGGRPITRPLQSGPARSTPPGLLSLLTATYSLCAPRLSHSPPPALDSILPPTALPFPVLLGEDTSSPDRTPPWPPGPPPSYSPAAAVGSSAGWGRGRSAAGDHPAYLASVLNARVFLESEPSQVSWSHSLFKAMLYSQLYPLQLFPRGAAHQDT